MTEDRFFKAKERMIKEHLIPRGITESKILETFRAVPREKFVPTDLKAKAYLDRPLPIDEGQTISQPYIVAKMIQAIDPQKDDKILEIGVGSGYAAAILAQIVEQVHGVERFEDLANQAQKRLKKLEYNNIDIHIGDGTTGWKESAPYEGILVSAAAPEIPDSLVEQLVEGGFLVIPIGNKKLQQLYQIQKLAENELIKNKLIKVRFVPLFGKEGW